MSLRSRISWRRPCVGILSVMHPENPVAPKWRQMPMPLSMWDSVYAIVYLKSSTGICPVAAPLPGSSGLLADFLNPAPSKSHHIYRRMCCWKTGLPGGVQTGDEPGVPNLPIPTKCEGGLDACTRLCGQAWRSIACGVSGLMFRKLNKTIELKLLFQTNI